jgi:nonsense-mediated mRNA decay protein 3
MQVEEDEETQQRSRGSADRMAQDEELFYQELEEDEETRAQVQIFKDENANNVNATAAAGDDEDDDAPEVPIEELLDELTLLQRQGDDEDDENDLDDSMQE